MFLVVFFSRLIHAESANDILLKNIVNKVNIASCEGRPFQLDGDFAVQINTPLQAHITWKWLSKDISSQEITIGPITELMYTGETIPTIAAMGLLPRFA